MQNETEFRFRSDRLSLDFVATLGGRYRGGIERLATPADLVRWIGLAMSVDVAGRPIAKDLHVARILREAVYRLVHPVTRHRPESADVATLNAWACRPDFAPFLGADARSVTLHSSRPIEAGFAVVARDAVDLVSGRLLSAVRECERPDCSLLFVDVSRPGQRRWCNMNSCGNRMKAARYRASHRDGDDLARIDDAARSSRA